MTERKPDREPEARPSADTTQPHAADQRLRAHGFRIVSRPRVGVPLWKRGGDLMTDRDAHAAVTADLLAATNANKRGRRR
jgi:hypothetical protein